MLQGVSISHPAQRFSAVARMQLVRKCSEGICLNQGPVVMGLLRKCWWPQPKWCITKLSLLQHINYHTSSAKSQRLLMLFNDVPWEPEGRYCHWLCTVIAPFLCSADHLWRAFISFWLSSDDILGHIIWGWAEQFIGWLSRSCATAMKLGMH